MKIGLAFLFCCSLFIACSSPEDPADKSDSISSEPVPVADANRGDRNGACCFETEQDFLRFLPDVCGEFTAQSGRTTALKCITDTLQHSSSTCAYTNADGHVLLVTLTDYCSSPDLLAIDYQLKFERVKGPERVGEFNEFEVAGSHHGFSSYDSRQRTAVLDVIVDKRFLLEITDQVTDNSKNVLALYQTLPLTALAAYGK